MSLLRQPLHPSITEQQISDLVENFYGRVAQNERLAPIFLARNHGQWSQHLDTMKNFWSSVLLKSGKYHGNPVKMHSSINELETSDFKIWLALFDETTREVLSADAVPLVNEVARRIATSLWYAKIGTIHDRSPFESAS